MIREAGVDEPDVRLESHRLPLVDAGDVWRLVMGTGLRSVTTALGPPDMEKVRRHLADWVERSGVTAVDLDIIYATKPAVHPVGAEEPIMSHETVVIEMLGAFNERRFEDFAASYAPDAVITYPQSGERIVGRDNILAMVQAFPSPPRFTITEVHSTGNVVVVEADVDYGQGPSWKGAFIYTMEGRLVVSESAHFGAPFEAADWRAPFRDD